MFKFSFYTVLFFLAVVGCTDDEDTLDCVETICTLEFRNYAITITNAANNNVALDTFQVIDITNNEDLTATFSNSQLLQYQETGRYPLYGDRFAEIHQNQSIEIVFKGFIDSAEVINVPFTVGADCCHTEIISGELNITIN